MNRYARAGMALLAAALLVGTMAGCSSAEPATETESAAPKEVKLGFAAPLTGDNALYGEGMKRAVELAIDEANASEEAAAKGIMGKMPDRVAAGLESWTKKLEQEAKLHLQRKRTG